MEKFHFYWDQRHGCRQQALLGLFICYFEWRNDAAVFGWHGRIQDMITKIDFFLKEFA